MDDCDTADIERLRPQINALALSMAQLQQQTTDSLEPRDKAIVLIASLDLMRRSSRNACRTMGGNRFLESIARAMKLTRFFGSQNLKQDI